VTNEIANGLKAASESPAAARENAALPVGRQGCETCLRQTSREAVLTCSGLTGAGRGWVWGD